MSQTQRIASLDVIKLIACFLVVALHACYTRERTITYSSVLYYSGVIAMPLFFIVHGFLLFGKTQTDVMYSYRKRDKVLLLVFCVNIVWSLWLLLTKKELSNPFSNMVQNLFYQNGQFWQLWFFGALLIIYMLFPLLDKLFLKSTKLFLMLCLAFILLQITVDAIDISWAVKGKGIFSREVNQTFRLVTHLSYFILGGGLKIIKDRVSRYVNIVTLLICYALALGYQFMMIRGKWPVLYCEYFYNNIFVILFAAVFFLFVLKTRIPEVRIVTQLANTILVVYIVHPLLLQWYSKTIHFDNNLLKLFAVFFASLLVGMVVNKIPYINRIVKI